MSQQFDLKRHRYPNVFISGDNRKLYTINLTPGLHVYGEDLVETDDGELRTWDPYRSKLAAMMLKGEEHLKLTGTMKVLYLGAAAGTTASHVSDIVREGRVYCVELSDRPFRDLVALCETRTNMIPILASARVPAEYNYLVESVDLVYQDISQRDQVEIFLKNVKMYLKSACNGVLMVKSRSIDVNVQPQKIFSEVKNQLKAEGLKLIAMKLLSPYQKDHAAFVIERK